MLLALGAASCGSSGSEDGAAATSFGPPSHKAGESWTYKSTTTLVATPAESPAPYEQTLFVDIAGERGAYIARLVDAKGSSVQVTVNVDGQVVNVGECSFLPSINDITFPLEVGRAWKVDFTDCGKTHTTGTGEVIGRETITTGAFGDVETLKVVVKRTSTTPADAETGTAGWSSSNTWTAYWAPKLGLTVKEHLDVPPTGESAHVVVDTELTKFVPAK